MSWSLKWRDELWGFYLELDSEVFPCPLGEGQKQSIAKAQALDALEAVMRRERPQLFETTHQLREYYYRMGLEAQVAAGCAKADEYAKTVGGAVGQPAFAPDTPETVLPLSESLIERLKANGGSMLDPSFWREWARSRFAEAFIWPLPSESTEAPKPELPDVPRCPKCGEATNHVPNGMWCRGGA